jgi:hypothetical protein
LAADFTWDWHNQQVIGRDDPSVANTSKLKESDRTALIDAIAARLQKPMSERGYSDDRIREVASIARIRIGWRRRCRAGKHNHRASSERSRTGSSNHRNRPPY